MTSPLGQEWLASSQNLGIRVTAPFVVTSGQGNDIEFDALVHDFGAKNGMLVFEQWDEAKAATAADLGFGYSCMTAGTYDESGIIEVLGDWGWSAPASSAKPSWLAQA